MDTEYHRRTKKFEHCSESVRQFEAELDQLAEPLQPQDGFDLEGLEQVVGCLARIFDSTAVEASYVLAPADMRRQPWVNDNFIDEVERQLGHVRDDLEQLANVHLADIPVGQLRQQLAAAIRRAKLGGFEYLPQDTQDQLQTVIAAVADDLDVYSRLRELTDLEGRAVAAVTRTEAAADVASKAAGKTADDAMSSFYASLADVERKRADNFRWLTAFLALLATATALAFVLGAGTGIAWLEIRSDDYVRLIHKAVLIAGIFAIAAYFARQAHQHRSMANWAGSLAVQLQTFDAYLSAVESLELRDELRKSFAARAFGDHPPMKGEPSVTPSAAAMDTAVGWASKLAGGGK